MDIAVIMEAMTHPDLEIMDTVLATAIMETLTIRAMETTLASAAEAMAPETTGMAAKEKATNP
jgi:hypothetical protein